MAIATTTFTGFRPEAIDFLADLAANNDRDVVPARARPSTSDCSRSRSRRWSPRSRSASRRAASRCWPIRSARSSGSTATRASRRTSRRTRRTSARASRGWSERRTGRRVVADGTAHGNGGYFHFQPGEMYVGGGMWMAEKPRLDAFRRAVVDEPDRVRAAIEDPGFLAAFGSVTRPRAPQARAARASRRPPDGRPVPLQGRRLRTAPVRRRGAVARRCPDIIADAYAAGMPVFRFLATVRA